MNLKNIFKNLRLRFQGRPSQLEKAKRKADRLHKKTGRRYRVFFFGNRYYAWTRQDIRDRQHSRLLKHHIKPGVDFDRISFYDTNNKTTASCS